MPYDQKYMMARNYTHKKKTGKWRAPTKASKKEIRDYILKQGSAFDTKKLVMKFGATKEKAAITQEQLEILNKFKKEKPLKRNIKPRFVVEKEMVPQYYVIDTKTKETVEQLNEKFEAEDAAKRMNKSKSVIY